MVRNSAGAMSSEISRNTAVLPNCFATLRMESRVAATVPGAFDSEAVAGKFKRRWCLSSSLLGRFHFVPDLVVPVAPRYVFPEIYAPLVVVQIVQMQVLLFLRRQI